ncbi:MAG: prefoldin subunit alpha [Desulfurococcales archaeon]|nr:prefoldin subunit alpha [Desulfurococcales archaeon]
MSARNQERGVTYREAVERLVSDINRVEEYIRSLQQNANIVLAELEELRIAREALEQLKLYKGEEALLALDRRGHVMARGVITGRDKVIANIGGEFLMEVPIDEAIKIITAKEGDLRNALNAINQELSSAYTLYERLRRALSQIVEEAEKKAKGESKSG